MIRVCLNHNFIFLIKFVWNLFFRLNVVFEHRFRPVANSYFGFNTQIHSKHVSLRFFLILRYLIVLKVLMNKRSNWLRLIFLVGNYRNKDLLRRRPLTPHFLDYIYCNLHIPVLLVHFPQFLIFLSESVETFGFNGFDLIQSPDTFLSVNSGLDFSFEEPKF